VTAIRDERDRYGRWLDLTGQLLRRPLVALPHEAIVTEMMRTFGAVMGSWQYVDASGNMRAQVWPSQLIGEAEIREWYRTSADQHPLLRWFAQTGNTAPQAVESVPRAIASDRCLADWRELVGSLPITDQMSIPIFLGGAEHRAFVISRQGDRFPDRDLLFARRLQPLLIGLERQAAALASWHTHAQSADHAAKSADEAGLTGREMAVLHLLAGGSTAAAIGRRLNIAPRTVTKHLEHIYTKLHTSDRLSAVLRAQQLGLLPRAGGVRVTTYDAPHVAPSGGRCG
jgi:DNA-binding CsgD family transcriptional regulator